MALLEKHLEIKESGIPGAGNGLFTTIYIAKGTRITEYKGRIATWKEVQNDDSNFYIFFVTQKHVIDASKHKKVLARYINDAKGLTRVKGRNNNTQFVKDKYRVFVEATRDIKEGSELCIGYGKEYWDIVRQNIKADVKKTSLKNA
ncbi:MAG: SET domain-containing protein [Ginsengibacter sp.]